MSIPKCLDFTNYNKYPTDANPTTNADMQEYLLNQNRMTQAFASCFWQPNTQYEAKQIIRSNSLPAGIYAVVTRAGRSGATEPAWKASGTVVDGGVTWTMRDIFAEIESKYEKVSTVSVGNSNVTVSDGTNTIALTPNILNFGHTNLINATYSNSGNNVVRIQAGTNCYIAIVSGINDGDTSYKQISLSQSPAITSNNNEIATTKFVKDQKYLVANDINGKLDIASVVDYIVERGASDDGMQWYRKWHSGWLEIGGRVENTTSSGTVTFAENLSFADTKYTLTVSQGVRPTAEESDTDINGVAESLAISNKTQTGFRYDITARRNFHFYVCGQGANN